MNYFEYTNLLVAKLQLKKAETVEIYDSMVGNGYISNRLEQVKYLQEVDKCHQLAREVEQLMLDILEGNVSPFDPID